MPSNSISFLNRDDVSLFSASIIMSLDFDKFINTKNFNYTNKKKNFEIIDRCQM